MIKTKLITIKRNLVINKICTKYCHLNNNNIKKTIIIFIMTITCIIKQLSLLL